MISPPIVVVHTLAAVDSSADDAFRTPTDAAPNGGGGGPPSGGKGDKTKAQCVFFTAEQKQEIEWAAFDPNVRKLIFDDDIDHGRRCQRPLLVAALRAFGVRALGDGAFEQSNDARYNRFERLRSELRAEHDAQVQQMQQTQLLHLQLVASANFNLQAQLADAQQQLADAKAQLLTAQVDGAALAAARSPAADKMRQAVAEAAAAEAARKQAEAARKQAEARAAKVERAIAPMEREIETYRAAPNDREVALALHESQRALAGEQARTQELEGARISVGKELSKLRAQLAAQQVQQERAAGTPRQLQLAAEAATAGREAAEQKLRECKAMMRAAAAEAAAAQDAAVQAAAATAQRASSPTSVMSDAPWRAERRPGADDKLPSASERGADLFVRVRKLHAGANTPYDPGICELLRRFVSETKIAKHNVAAALALAFTIHTGEVPSEANLINEALIDGAFEKLGALDQEKRAAVNKARKHGVAIAGDTGNRKHCAQYKGAMEVMVACVWEEGVGPVAQPLACKDLGNDQTARQGSTAYKAAFDRGGFTAEQLIQAETDNTEHAQLGMRNFIADALKDVPPEKRRAIVENCYRHLSVLEEQACMRAAFPGDEVVNYLRMFYEVWHAQPEYYSAIWAQCGLPPKVFEALLRMPEPTSAKWQVPVDCAKVFLLGLEVAPGKEGFQDSMLEVFARQVLQRMRGTSDVERPQDAGTHPHRTKWEAMSALLCCPTRLAGLYFYLDLWAFFGERHEFCLARSRFGNFAPSFHRHEMAVRVCKDAEWYRKARDDPASVFPQTELFLSGTWRRRAVDKISEGTRTDMRLRMAAALKAAEASHLKWSADVWRRARHLFGAVCDEKYRAGCAQQTLICLGYGRELGEALDGSSSVGGGGVGGGVGDGAAGGGGAGGGGGAAGGGDDGAGAGESGGRLRSRVAEAEAGEAVGTRQGRGAVQPVGAVDAVQEELYRCIRLRHEDGSLRKEWELWGLGEHLDEWLTLATAPAGDTRASAVLSVERTPQLYNTFIDMLFIGLSDNTRLESYVSLYKTFCHVNMTAATVELMFLYHAGLEAERLQLKQPEMRSTNGRAVTAKSKARADKPLRHASSKKQQQEVCRLALVRANQVDHKRYFQRGPLALAQLHWEERQRQQRFRASAADLKLRAQTLTSAVCPSGQKRKAVAPPEAWLYLLNPLLEAGAEALKRKGTGYGNDALKAKRSTEKKRRVALKPPPGTVVPVKNLSGRRMSEKQLRRAAAPKAVVPLKRKRAAPARAATAAAVASMEEQLQVAAREEAEAEQQEAQRQAEAEATAQRLEGARQETARVLAEHQARVRAEAAAAEAAREAAAAVRVQSAEASRKRQLCEIEAQVKAFSAAFKKQHGRSPKSADLESAANTRMKVLVQQYQFMKHGVTNQGLQGARDRTRAITHRW